MRILLDTHALLWFVTGDPRCSAYAQALIANRTNRAAISVASLWEIAIKISLGKLTLTIPYSRLATEHLVANAIEVLPIEVTELELVAQLPFHHRDPFDRLLIAQSLALKIPVVSADHNLDLYGVQRIW